MVSDGGTCSSQARGTIIHVCAYCGLDFDWAGSCKCLTEGIQNRMDFTTSQNPENLYAKHTEFLQWTFVPPPLPPVIIGQYIDGSNIYEIKPLPPIYPSLP